MNKERHKSESVLSDSLDVVELTLALETRFKKRELTEENVDDILQPYVKRGRLNEADLPTLRKQIMISLRHSRSLGRKWYLLEGPESQPWKVIVFWLFIFLLAAVLWIMASF